MGVENELVLVFGSTLTWFLGGGRKCLGFSVLINTDLVYVGDRNLLEFIVGIEINLVLVWG